jgi:hypothetical protein
MLSMNSEAVLYAAPRSGRDRLALVLALATEPIRDVSGSFTWARAGGTFSAAFWTHSAAVRGSALPSATALPASGEMHSTAVAPSDTRVFSFTQPGPSQFLLSPSSAKLRYASAIGLFAGDLPPTTARGKATAYEGVWLPEEGRGYGVLLPPAAGAVELRAEGPGLSPRGISTAH